MSLVTIEEKESILWFPIKQNNKGKFSIDIPKDWLAENLLQFRAVHNVPRFSFFAFSKKTFGH